MRGTVSKYPITLKRKQRRWLKAVVRRRTPSHWLVQRCSIVLLSAGGTSIKAVGAALSADRQVVRRWRKRFVENGLAGLKDRPRGGRPRRIAVRVWEKIAILVVQPPTNFGLQLARWTVRDLSKFVARRYGWSVSPASISRFLRGMSLKPHRVKYWLNPKDPDFDCATYRRGPIVIITDNINTRTGPDARAWLASHPRVSFVFTPYHGSWLNQVESWFGHSDQ